MQVLRTRLYNIQRQQADSERTEARRKQVSGFSKKRLDTFKDPERFLHLGRAGFDISDTCSKTFPVSMRV